jgi:hypothetical protein
MIRILSVLLLTYSPEVDSLVVSPIYGNPEVLGPELALVLMG